MLNTQLWASLSQQDPMSVDGNKCRRHFIVDRSRTLQYGMHNLPFTVHIYISSFCISCATSDMFENVSLKYCVCRRFGDDRCRCCPHCRRLHCFNNRLRPLHQQVMRDVIQTIYAAYCMSLKITDVAWQRLSAIVLRVSGMRTNVIILCHLHCGKSSINLIQIQDLFIFHVSRSV